MSTKNADVIRKKEMLNKEETISLIEMFSDLLNAYGKFSESLGKIQKTHEEAYKRIFSYESLEQLPEMMSKIMEEAPPELSRLVIRIFSKMTVFLPRISKIMELSANEKIALGENLKSLAKDFKKLLEWAKKEEKKYVGGN